MTELSNVKYSKLPISRLLPGARVCTAALDLDRLGWCERTHVALQGLHTVGKSTCRRIKMNESQMNLTNIMWHYIRRYCIYDVEAETKWPPFCRLHFYIHFLISFFSTLIKISMTFVAKGIINHVQTLIEIMVWCRLDNKPLSESMTTKPSDAHMRHSASMRWRVKTKVIN